MTQTDTSQTIEPVSYTHLDREDGDDEYDDYASGRDSDEVNPHMHKIMKILTVVVIAIIVLILVFTVGKADVYKRQGSIFTIFPFFPDSSRISISTLSPTKGLIFSFRNTPLALHS